MNAKRQVTNVPVGNNFVVIGCRLPNGIILDHPLEAKKRVEIKGLNKSLLIGSTHVTTEVDAEFWENWKLVNANFPALKNGAIFEAVSVADAASKNKELVEEKTGFEKAKQNEEGVKKVKNNED